jgi:c-di-GMP-binding flagellar brake protein YcgR
MDSSAAQHYVAQAWPTSRQFQRAKLELPVEIHIQASQYRGWSMNISEGGFATKLPASLRCGDEISATLILPAGHSIKVKAIVRHGNGFVYGCEFLSVSSDDLVLIRAFVLNSTTKPRRIA